MAMAEELEQLLLHRDRGQLGPEQFSLTSIHRRFHKDNSSHGSKLRPAPNLNIQPLDLMIQRPRWRHADGAVEYR
jgi:hypothetical protein